MPSIAELHRVAYQCRPSGMDSYLNCGAINRHIRNELNDAFGLIASLSVGELARHPRRRFGAEHAWCIVPAQHVTENTPVIIDGALDQFCTEKYENGYVSVGLRPVEEFPPRVTVVARNDTYNAEPVAGLYDHFIEIEREGPTETLVQA